MLSILLASVALVLVVVGRVTRLEVLRRLNGGFALLALALVAQAVVDLAGLGGEWPKWTGVAVLLVIGSLAARLVMVAVFEWLLAQRAGVEVPRLARDIVAVAAHLAIVAAVLHSVADVELGGLLATSAVITVVIGLALQETLGTLLSGLALAWEKRLDTGTWVELDGTVGRVEELGWRSTVLRTVLGERILVPNSTVARATLRLLGNGSRPVAVRVMVGVSYQVPPHEVKEVLSAVARDCPGVLPRPRPEILTTDFADSAIVYECRMWTLRPWSDSFVRDPFLTRAYTALQRAGMEIPFPQRTLHVAPRSRPTDTAAAVRSVLESSPVFAGLHEQAVATLAERSRTLRFAPGEAVVLEGDASRALYLLATGTVAVEAKGVEVGALESGNVFGEIAFLTGKPRSATVRAKTALEVVEVDAEALRALLADHAELAEQLAERMARRMDRLEAAEARAATPRERRGLVAALREGLLRLVGGGRPPDPESGAGT